MRFDTKANCKDCKFYEPVTELCLHNSAIYKEVIINGQPKTYFRADIHRAFDNLTDCSPSARFFTPRLTKCEEDGHDWMCAGLQDNGKDYNGYIRFDPSNMEGILYVPVVCLSCGTRGEEAYIYSGITNEVKP